VGSQHLSATEASSGSEKHISIERHRRGERPAIAKTKNRGERAVGKDN